MISIRKTLVVSVAGVAVVLAGVLVAGRATDRFSAGGRTFERVEMRLNDYTSSSQGETALDMAPDGRVVAVWDSRRQEDGSYGVYARWVDPRGLISPAEEHVNVATFSQQMEPSVSLGRDGKAFFAWTSFGQDGQAGAIMTRERGNEVLANQEVNGDQGSVTTARLADGKLVAVWVSQPAASRATSVRYRLFQADGQPLGAEQVVDAAGDHVERLPAVTAAADGFVVAWGRSTTTGDIEGIFARRFDATGTPVAPAFRVSRPGNDAVEPSLGADAKGDLVIGWMRLDEDYDVVLRRFDASGAPLCDEFTVNTSTDGWKNGVAVAVARDGRFAAVWNKHTDGGLDADIFARLFGVDGVAVSPEFRVNAHTEGIQMLRSASGARRVALGEDGRLAVAWQGNSGQGDKSAANLTLLLPERHDAAGLLASGVRATRSRLAFHRGGTETHFDLTAAPHVPPVYDPTTVSPVLDPDSFRRDGAEIGFTAFPSTGWTPPDPHMAAGPTHLVGIVNGGIRSFTKSDGTMLWSLDINGSNGFWGPVGAAGTVFDPEVIWDVLSQRFFAMACEQSGGRSYFLLGISKTASAATSSDWWLYRIDVTSIAGGDIDSPNMAVDANYVYLTSDHFGPDKHLIYIIAKSSVMEGGTPSAQHYLRTGTHSFGLPSMYTADAPCMYMIEHFDSEPSSLLRLWAINDPGGTPTIQSVNLTVPTYYAPGDARSRGTSTVVELFEARFWSAIYRDGKIYACDHISEASSPRLAVARWYEIDMQGWPTSGQNPVLVQSGTETDNSVPRPPYLFFNSLNVNPAGDVVMLMARSSLDEYFSIARSYRLSDDPPGEMVGPDYVKQSTALYSRNRWGDYSAVAVDPDNPYRFWMHQEYTAGSAWQTWIQSETLPSVASVDDLPTTSGAVLLHVAPTPTRGPTGFEFALPAAGDTRLEIFDANGRLVRGIALGTLGASDHRVSWDGRDEGGRAVASGVYFARLLSAGREVTRARITVAR